MPGSMLGHFSTCYSSSTLYQNIALERSVFSVLLPPSFDYPDIRVAPVTLRVTVMLLLDGRELRAMPLVFPAVA